MFFRNKSNFSTILNFTSDTRNWFFFIDHKVSFFNFSNKFLKGLLFLEEVEPKNYANSLKDERFLVIIAFSFLISP